MVRIFKQSKETAGERMGPTDTDNSDTSDSDDPLSQLITKAPATRASSARQPSTGKRLSMMSQSAVSASQPVSSVFGKSTGDDSDDDMGLITAPKNSNSVQRWVKHDHEIKRKMESKNEELSQQRYKTQQLRQKLQKELADCGVESEKQTRFNDKLADKLVGDGSDILAYNRSFYYFGTIVPNEYRGHPFELHSKHITHDEVIDAFDLRKSPFVYTTVSYLTQVDSFLSMLISEEYRPRPAAKPDKDEEKSLGLIQDPDSVVKTKLQHVSHNVLVALLRTSIYIKWKILDQGVDDRVLKHFFYALCDTNLILHHHSHLQEFASLVVPLSSCISGSVLESIDRLIRVSVYDYEEVPQFLVDRTVIQFKYNILSFVASATQLSASPLKDAVVRDIAGFLSYDSLTDFVNRIVRGAEISGKQLFETPSAMTQLYQAHYSLRLLNHVVDHDFDPKELKYVSDEFEHAKKLYHTLMGDISFSRDLHDHYNQKLKVVSILEEDQTFLDYFHVKFHMYYAHLSKDKFYQ